MSEAIVANTPDKIEMFRLLALRGALKLELVGMCRRGQSAYSIIKSQYGFRGSKQRVLDQFEGYIRDRGGLQ